MPRAVASASGKAILLGEHAVVYGEPALAVPLPGLVTEVEASFERGPAGLALAHDRGIDTTMAARMAAKALELLDGVPGGRLELRIGGNLPIGVGMGSSAALAVAILRALAELAGRRLEGTELALAATELERLAHGNPSGIDPAVVAAGRPILFRKGSAPEPLPLPHPFPLVLAEIPRAESTGAIVAAVRALYDAEPHRVRPAIREIGDLVRSAAAALAGGDLAEVGRLMDANHALLDRLTVSSAELDRLVEAARAAGALGAKLSGAGRGGIVLALCPPGETAPVARALAGAGARQVHDLEALG